MISTQLDAEATQLAEYYQKLSSPRLLLLDDCKTTSAIVQDAFKARRFNITTVTNGPDALTCILKQREFNAILCDMSTRHPPGLMFYKAVTRIRPHLRDRFVFMTGHCGNGEVDTFIRSINGVQLWKPFETHVLLETIDLVLKKNDRFLPNVFDVPR